MPIANSNDKDIGGLLNKKPNFMLRYGTSIIFLFFLALFVMMVILYYKVGKDSGRVFNGRIVGIKHTAQIDKADNSYIIMYVEVEYKDAVKIKIGQQVVLLDKGNCSGNMVMLVKDVFLMFEGKQYKKVARIELSIPFDRSQPFCNELSKDTFINLHVKTDRTYRIKHLLKALSMRMN